MRCRPEQDPRSTGPVRVWSQHDLLGQPQQPGPARAARQRSPARSRPRSTGARLEYGDRNGGIRQVGQDGLHRWQESSGMEAEAWVGYRFCLEARPAAGRFHREGMANGAHEGKRNRKSQGWAGERRAGRIGTGMPIASGRAWIEVRGDSPASRPARLVHTGPGRRASPATGLRTARHAPFAAASQDRKEPVTKQQVGGRGGSGPRPRVDDRPQAERRKSRASAGGGDVEHGVAKRGSSRPSCPGREAAPRSPTSEEAESSLPDDPSTKRGG